MKKIKINGIEYPCALTIGTLKRFKAETGKDLDAINDVFSICTLLFLALQATCKKQGAGFPYASADDLMDDLDLQEIEPITQVLFGGKETEATDEKKRMITGGLTASSE